jgi:hypothetical protein
MWTAYAISTGELENWLKGLTWQATESPDPPIWNSLSDIFKFDAGYLHLVYKALSMSM